MNIFVIFTVEISYISFVMCSVLSFPAGLLMSAAVRGCLYPLTLMMIFVDCTGPCKLCKLCIPVNNNRKYFFVTIIPVPV